MRTGEGKVQISYPISISYLRVGSAADLDWNCLKKLLEWGRGNEARKAERGKA